MTTTLGEQFPPITEELWRAQVEQELKGASFERTLLRSTLEGITISPLYTASQSGAQAERRLPAPGEPPFTRGHRPTPAGDGWQLVQRYEQPDPVQLNRELLEGLMKGGRGAWLARVPPQEQGVWLKKALQGVEPSACVLRLGWTSAESIHECLHHWKMDGKTPTGGLVLHRDPLAHLAETGKLTKSLAALSAENGKLLQAVALEQGLPLSLAVSTEVYHNAGAHAAQELGLALAAYVAMLRGLEQAGLSPEQAVPHLSFSMAVGRDILMEAAKLRALRALWWQVISCCGVSAETASRTQPLLHALTSRRTLTRWDPWVNLLRVTTQTWAAVLGGAEQLTTAAFDEAAGLPEKLGQRIARNTQLILAEESHLHTVLDPLGGAYYVEALTEALAEAGWKFFQQVERLGGLASALSSGWLAAQLEQTSQARQRAFATRKEPLTGLSEFPWAGEAPLQRATPAPVSVEVGPGVEAISPLPYRPDGAPFEELRARAWALKLEGKSLLVYLATLGPLAEHHARTMFAQNFFWTGGCDVRLGDAEDAQSAAALLERHLPAAKQAAVVCLSGTNALYAQHAVELVRSLKDAGIAHIWLAGKPGLEPALREAGLSQALYVGCDVVQTLRSLLDEMGGIA